MIKHLILVFSMVLLTNCPLSAKIGEEFSRRCPKNCPLSSQNPHKGHQQIDIRRFNATDYGMFVVEDDCVLEINSVVFEGKSKKYRRRFHVLGSSGLVVSTVTVDPG